MSDVQTVYPCHVCKDTMIYGFSYSLPREYPPVSPGKLYWNPSLTAAASIFQNTTPSQLVDCYNCKGTGVVSERRSTDRRKNADRRSR